MINLKTISGFDEKLPEWYLIEERFKEIIKKNYSLSWFTPLDTPNIERVEVLTSKWADDNEIYGIKRLKAEWKEAENFEMGLRFDLTVPLARYVAKYEWEISFPFKRQHIARVYRWERPQKGRYREFYQADVDIIWNGKLPLFADTEILSTIYNSLKELDFWGFVINVNNKKLLSGFIENLWIIEIWKTISIIDKKDKVNKEKLVEMFKSNNLDEKQISWIIKMIELSENKTKTNLEVFNFFEQIDNKLLKEWLEELKEVYTNLINLWVEENFLKINPAISRWLNYYTWLVFETFISWAENMWSISSGGRYENLASNFTKNSFPWVGWSIWLSRLLAVLDELKLLNYDKKTITTILFINEKSDDLEKKLELVRKIRDKWINTEIYLDKDVKFDKQVKYAFNKKIDFIVTNNSSIIKNMNNWEKQDINEYIKKM